MKEELLYYIWRFQQFNHNDLSSTNGQSLQIVHPGTLNQDSGPDFFNGLISLDNIKWAGNIEIHIKSSDWKLHKHENNPIYDKVILHVVWVDDDPIYYKNGDRIPTLELKGRINKKVIEKYETLGIKNAWVPCQTYLSTTPDIIKQQAIQRNLVERLEHKSNRLNQILTMNKNDWEATLFQLLAKYFGFKLNGVPFELLASSIDFSIIRKHQTNEKQLSALLFGQAGFLDEEFRGSYPQALKDEYKFLKNKYQLTSLDQSLWKFMRMRPSNFPTIRLAQLVTLLNENKGLFQKVIESKNVDELLKLFQSKAGIYWDSHFRFDIPAAKRAVKRVGKSSVEILIINVVIPLLFNYSKKTGDEMLNEKALQFLQDLPSEKNSIIRKWQSYGIFATSAFDSQGLLQLKMEHCNNKNCLNCAIGNSILKVDI